jgi:DNA-binding winged helix-turn-helix (wHTH) protein
MNLPLAMPKPRHEAIGAALEFGNFRILLRQRRLLAGGVPVELGARAFDTLMVLVEADGALVTKDELQRRVWGHVVVSQNNLKVQVAALRKALGEDRGLILTDHGRGYRFTAEVRWMAEAPERLPVSGVASSRWPRHRCGAARSAHRMRRRRRTGSAWRGAARCRGSFDLAGRTRSASAATSGTVPGSCQPVAGKDGPDGSGRRNPSPRRPPIAGAPSSPASLVLARPAGARDSGGV